MNIFVQKLSDPLTEWSIDTEPSDTLQSVASKLFTAEYNYDGSYYADRYITLYFAGSALDPVQTLSNYNIQKNNHLTSSYSPPNSATICNLSDYNSDSPNGLYDYTFVDPGNNPYWLRTVGINTFFLGFNNNGDTGTWVVADWNNFGNIIATTNSFPASAATTPFDLTANLVWSDTGYGVVTVSEGDTGCQVGPYCDPSYDMFAVPGEDGCHRARRLWNLGYI